MPDRWFRLPETGDGSNDNPIRPDTKGYDIDGFSGNKTHPDGSPYWVTRVYADTTTLDALANETDVVELSNVPKSALDTMFGQNRTKSAWKKAFNIQ